MSLLLFGLLVAAPAQARPDERLDPPEVTHSRGLLSIRVKGVVAPAGEPLVARLRRDERTALEVAVTPDGSGAFSATLLTSRLLMADRYVLEVVRGAGDAALVSRPFQVGSDDDVKAARARLEAWYVAAHGALRELAVGLERRGRYHRALAGRVAPGADAGQTAALHLARFEQALQAWSAALCAARMDLATWDRRLVLPWRPDVGAALLEVVRALEAQADAWHAALARRAAAPTPDDLEAVAGRLIAARGLPATTIETWRPGALAEPPPGAPAGTAVLEGLTFTDGFAPLVDATGFALDVPAGFTALPADQRPTERLLLEGGPTRLIVQVQDLPDARQGDVLADAVETGAFEQYLSYKRLATDRLVDAQGAVTGVRLEFLAQVSPTSEEMVRVTQVSRWPPTGGRVFHLQVVYPPDAAAPAWLERVAASFEASGAEAGR